MTDFHFETPLLKMNFFRLLEMIDKRGIVHILEKMMLESDLKYLLTRNNLLEKQNRIWDLP